MKKIIDWVKPAVIATMLLLVLKWSGLLGGISDVAQAALLKTGVRNADHSYTAAPNPFDFNFKIRTLQGQPVDFQQFKGKVVFLNLWATWCGPCRAEMPGIQQLYNTIDRSQIEFVMLSLDRSEHRQKVADYISKAAYSFPAYTPIGNLPAVLNVPSIPTTLIINKQGQIVSTEVGATNFNTKRFKKFLQQLAEE
ncbi:MAG: TlpA family protein disulfide reductase [Bacteroidota bacterium]